MFRSRSAPGLGKGENPLLAYCGDTVSEISPEEEEAEQLYYAAISASLTQNAFVILAKALTRRSPNAGAYLTWLILYRGQHWPVVEGTILNA